MIPPAVSSSQTGIRTEILHLRVPHQNKSFPWPPVIFLRISRYSEWSQEFGNLTFSQIKNHPPRITSYRAYVNKKRRCKQKVVKKKILHKELWLFHLYISLISYFIRKHFTRCSDIVETIWSWGESDQIGSSSVTYDSQGWFQDSLFSIADPQSGACSMERATRRDTLLTLNKATIWIYTVDELDIVDIAVHNVVISESVVSRSNPIPLREQC